MRNIRRGFTVGLVLILFLCTGGVAQVTETSTHYAQAPSPWKQLAKLTESNGKEQDWLGWSVAVSKDSKTVAVGAAGWCPQQGFNGCGQGAIFVFVKPASGWADMTQTALLTASDGKAGEYLGESVAVSDDGSTIVAGAPLWPSDDTFRGATYVFVKPAGGWRNISETARLTSSDGNNVSLGQSVAISGHTVVAGGPSLNTLQGAAYVFVEPRNGWTSNMQTARLTPSDGKLGNMGYSVAISGGTVVAGAPSADGKAGNGAYVFVKPKNGWKNKTETAKLTASDGIGFRLGYSVSITGGTIVAGAPYRHPRDNGAAYVFARPTKGWKSMTQTARLTLPHSGDVGDVFGFSVVAQNQGKAIGIGCPGCLGGQGAAFTFAEPASGWRTTSKFVSQLSASDGVVGNRVGFCVFGAGAVTVAGAPYAKVGANPQQGAVYVFGW